MTVSSRLLSNVFVGIHYSIEAKVNFWKGGEMKNEKVAIPFEMQEREKIYPFEELVVSQKIRCYHDQGREEDKVLKSKVNQCVKYFCPEFLFDYLNRDNTVFKTQRHRYDLFHL